MKVYIILRQKHLMLSTKQNFIINDRATSRKTVGSCATPRSKKLCRRRGWRRRKKIKKQVRVARGVHKGAQFCDISSCWA